MKTDEPGKPKSEPTLMTWLRKYAVLIIAHVTYITFILYVCYMEFGDENEFIQKESFYSLIAGLVAICAVTIALWLDRNRKDRLSFEVEELIQNRFESLHDFIPTVLKPSGKIFEGSFVELYIRPIDSSIARLNKECDVLSSRANLSIGLGASVTVAAVGILVWSLLDFNNFQKNVAEGDNYSQVLYIVIRVTLVAVIEAFAFFFLRLYRSLIREIKFYQNEITNLDQKKSALLAAFLKNGPEQGGVVMALITNDRNATVSENAHPNHVGVDWSAMVLALSKIAAEKQTKTTSN